MKTVTFLLLAAAAFLAGCGKEERLEAIRLTKALSAHQTDFDKANALEKDFVSSARPWCEGITTNGSGRGVELDQNASVAAELAKNAVAISAHLSEVRQALDGQSLKAEYAQGVRADLVTQLTKRQRLLQDMRAALEQAAPEFLSYRNIKSYAGDTYPGGMGKLDKMLKAYRPPDNVLATALAGLKTKYTLTPKDL